MFKKLLLCIIAIAASSNVLYGSYRDTKQTARPTYFKLRTALTGAGFGSLCATFFSAPCLFRYAAYTPAFGVIGSIVGGTSAAMSTWIPVTVQNINGQLAEDGIIPDRANPEQIQVAPYKYALTRGWLVAAVTGSLTGLVATYLCFAGYTFDDFRNLISR